LVRDGSEVLRDPHACVGSHKCTAGRPTARARRRSIKKSSGIQMVRVATPPPFFSSRAKDYNKTTLLLPVVDLGLDAERVAPPDQLDQDAVRVRHEGVLVGRAAGEELLRFQREAQRLAEPLLRPRVEAP